MAQYEKIQGTIEAMNRTGKNFKLDDGEWYSAFKKEQLGGAEVGDTIRFDMEAKDVGDKTFFNVKGNVSFIGDDGKPSRNEAAGASARTSRDAAPRGRDAAPARSAPARSSSGGGESADARQTSIIRQNSLTQANAMYATLARIEPDVYAGIPAEEMAENIIAAARLFEAYSAGN